MPVFQHAQLHQISERILIAAGVAANDAATVARELAEANLVGHDSHGVMRLMQYVEYIEQGFVQPQAAVELVLDDANCTIVDGHFHFGQVTATVGLESGMAKAAKAGTATVFLRNCNHVGRLGSYAYQAAQAGYATAMCVNAPGPGRVTPFGGAEGRMGTNPIAFSAPWNEQPLVLDMTSSATAEGKVRVAFQKGVPVPEGWIIDAKGNPTTNPADLYGPLLGSILPLGGALGFKGFGLSVMIDVFAGMLSGSGVCRDDLPRGANGVWMYLIKVDHVTEMSAYKSLIETYVANLKSTPLQPGVDEILMPGEIEQRRRVQREQDGVDVPAETWRQLQELAGKLNADLADIQPADGG